MEGKKKSSTNRVEDAVPGLWVGRYGFETLLGHFIMLLWELLSSHSAYHHPFKGTSEMLEKSDVSYREGGGSLRYNPSNTCARARLA